MLTEEVLELLQCPLTGKKLSFAPDQMILKVNEAIANGNARDRIEQKVSQKIDGGLVTEEGVWLYPIREEIPTLVVEEAIDMRPT
ncbi:MAG: Trm112 family protein [Rubripirellula sp.]|nr:Trm112 family protein [Rubripirellula sp.]